MLRLAAVLLRFNRGTLLLLDPPPGLDVAALPGVLWDARIQAHRAPACAHKAIRSRLKREGVSFSDQVPERDPHPAPWPTLDLRPYQDAALCAWELAGRRGVVVLPTGSGKTGRAARETRERLAEDRGLSPSLTHHLPIR